MVNVDWAFVSIHFDEKELNGNHAIVFFDFGKK
jgi:hypothetical protein